MSQALTGSVSWYDSITTITASGFSVPASDTLVGVDGYSSPGDRGGGLFWWNGSSTATADGGTIFQISGVATGRWFRLYSGPLNVHWFGAKGDGVTDDTSAINGAIAAANATTVGGRTVFLPSGSYRVSAGLSPVTASGVYIVGENATSTNIYPATSVDGGFANLTSAQIIQFGNATSRVTGGGVRDLAFYFDGSGSAPSGTCCVNIYNAQYVDCSRIQVSSAWTVMSLGSATTTANNIYVSHLLGSVWNSGTNSFSLLAGSLFYGHDIQLSVSGPVPPTGTNPFIGTGGGQVLSGTNFMEVNTNGGPASGLGWDTVELRAVMGFYYAIGLYLYAGLDSTGHTALDISFVQLADCTFDNCGYGIAASGVAAGSVSGILVTNSVFVGWDGQGITLGTSPAVSITEVAIDNCFIHNTGYQAVAWGSNAYDVTLNQCLTANIDRLGGSTTACIAISGATDFSVTNCSFGRASTGSIAPYAISMAGTEDRFTVCGNRLHGATASTIGIPAPSSSKVFANNAEF